MLMFNMPCCYTTIPRNLNTLESIWSKTCIRNFTVYILDWLPNMETG